MNEQEFYNKLKIIKEQTTNEINDSLKLEILFQSLEKTSNFAEFRELVFGEIVRLEVHNAVQRIQNKRN